MVTIVDNVVYGGKSDLQVPEGSFGQYLHRVMKERTNNDVSQINADTGEEKTHTEFLQMCESIAVGLESMGVKPGDIVALLGENTMRISAAAFASLFLAAAIAPLDETYKSFELKILLKDYKPQFIFCNQTQVSAILSTIDDLGLKSTIILLDADETNNTRVNAFPSVIGKIDSSFIPKGVSNPGREVAMVIPSSGSTSLPKGVAISHNTAKYYLSQTVKYASGNFVLQFSHLYWISGIGSLINSAVSKRVFTTTEDMGSFIRAARTYQPTFTFLAPPMVALLFKHPDFKPEHVKSIQAIITGGAALPQWLKEEMPVKLPGAFHAHLYGMTETCGGITRPFPTDDVNCTGHVQEDFRVKIIDPVTQKILPIGTTGEILVQAPLPFIGYLGNPEATKTTLDDEGWIHTGDLGHLDEKGLLYIEGRIKQLIKFQNHQISPEEIESCLSAMPGILDVGVVGIPDEQDESHVMALVVKDQSSNISEADVKNYVKENLSESKHLRGGVRFVEEIPRTQAKKMRRDQLQKLANSLIN